MLKNIFPLRVNLVKKFSQRQVDYVRTRSRLIFISPILICHGTEHSIFPSPFRFGWAILPVKLDAFAWNFFFLAFEFQVPRRRRSDSIKMLRHRKSAISCIVSCQEQCQWPRRAGGGVAESEGKLSLDLVLLGSIAFSAEPLALIQRRSRNN